MNTSAQIMLANSLRYITEGKINEASDLLNRALSLEPANADVLRLLAVVASMKFNHSQALEYINQSLALRPDNAYAFSNKGNILKNLGRYEEALSALDTSIQLDPFYAEAYNNRANAMQGLHQYEEALEWYDKAIALDPTYADAYSNKGNTLEGLHRHDEAMECYNKATAINPQHIEAYWAKAHSQLSRGKFEDGWQNYEARWFRKGAVSVLLSNIPRLESARDIAGKKVLILAEQGLGDTLQFCRYIKVLAMQGAKVTFRVQKPLINVLHSLADFCTLVADDANLLDKFDFQSPLLSLPLVVGTTLDSIPAEIPYLSPSQEKLEIFADNLPKTPNLKVGLIWNGGFRVDRPDLWSINERRNIDLEKISKLRAVSGVDFYSLQKGDPAESELTAKKDILWPNIINCVQWLEDFSDTAALIANLDLIISVDTSSAHLAGALGKPVWILNRYDACWRWLRGREDTPWYPTAKIYQQEKPGDWDGVIDRVIADLEIKVRKMPPNQSP